MPPPVLPEHTVDALIREIKGQRQVFRTRLAGVACVTRILLPERVHPNHAALIARAAVYGRGAFVGLPESVALTLQGYHDAAKIPRPEGPPQWPRALAAGLTADGYAFITTEWIEGRPIPEIAPVELATCRIALTIDVLSALAIFHRHNVAYGDLKPENIVVRPDGGASFIDLDTMRDVGHPSGHAVTCHITRSWAAPEQERERQTWMASDLWAFARIVWQLWPEGVPSEWAHAIAACRATDPLRRPHTDALLAVLLGRDGELVDWEGNVVSAESAHADRGPTGGSSGGGATERVAEGSDATERMAENSGATERMGESPPSPAPYVPTNPLSAYGEREHPPADPPRIGLFAALFQSVRDMSGCMQGVFIVGGAFAVLCAGTLTYGRWQVGTLTDDHATELSGALQAYKTRRELNNKTQRTRILEMADALPFYAPVTPRWLATRALALVWGNGLQDSGLTWTDDDDRARFTDAGAAVELVRRSDLPDALLARATYDGAFCRINTTDVSALTRCDTALETLDRFKRALPTTDAYHWLRIEAAWTEVLVRSKRVHDSATMHLPSLEAEVEQARAVCVAADAWMAWAPVNGPELLQDCLGIAAVSQDWANYLAWSQALIAADTPPLDRSTLSHLYAAAGEGCESTRVDRKRADWAVSGDPWCLAVGYYARGCAEPSRETILQSAAAKPDHPWDSLSMAVLRLPANVVCAK